MDESLQNLTPESHSVKQQAFLTAFGLVGSVTEAAELAGCARQSHYDWLRDDPNYQALFDAAREEATDRLEMEARRRAVQGVDKPVFYKGSVVGMIREYSDSLLQTLLRAHNDKFRERVQNTLTGPDGGPVQVEHSDPQLARVLAMLNASAEEQA